MCGKSFSTETSLPTQSPALGAIFRSMGIWTLLSYIVPEGFFPYFLLSATQSFLGSSANGAGMFGGFYLAFVWKK